MDFCDPLSLDRTFHSFAPSTIVFFRFPHHFRDLCHGAVSVLQCFAGIAADLTLFGNRFCCLSKLYFTIS
uniref:Uncharacterized protein n=1 Tax=Panagrolaimus sp. JU765 TaxID=591449 RepID=A0AC34RL16_9BILA